MSDEIVSILAAERIGDASADADFAALVERDDGTIIESASPGYLFARFDGPAAAVRCAIALQQQGTEAPARFRIGINDQAPPDGAMAVGDGDSDVSRLVALAEPGGICLARTVYDDVRFQIGLAVDTTRDPRHVVFVCQEIRRKQGEMNLLEAGAVRITAAALRARADGDRPAPSLFRRIAGLFAS